MKDPFDALCLWSLELCANQSFQSDVSSNRLDDFILSKRSPFGRKSRFPSTEGSTVCLERKELNAVKIMKNPSKLLQTKEDRSFVSRTFIYSSSESRLRID